MSLFVVPSNYLMIIPISSIEYQYRITIFTVVFQTAKPTHVEARAVAVSTLVVVLHFKESKFKKLFL